MITSGSSSTVPCCSLGDALDLALGVGGVSSQPPADRALAALVAPAIALSNLRAKLRKSRESVGRL